MRTPAALPRWRLRGSATGASSGPTNVSASRVSTSSATIAVHTSPARQPTSRVAIIGATISAYERGAPSPPARSADALRNPNATALIT